MQSMAASEGTQLEIDPSLIGTLELEGLDVSYVNLGNEPLAPGQLRLGGTEYAYHRSFPITGHSAVMPNAVRDLLSDEKQVLVAERSGRYYVYLA